MTSVSGLDDHHRAHAREIIANGVALLMRDPANVHYTQGPMRWEGIAHKLKVIDGRWPHYGDCSSTVTWLLWNGLYVPYGVRDVVNGANWQYGYTGTMLQHGKVVQHYANAKIGDCFIYGSGSTGAHTTIVIGRNPNGKLRVCSHGGEAGPFILDYDYRGDVMSLRRYI